MIALEKQFNVWFNILYAYKYRADIHLHKIFGFPLQCIFLYCRIFGYIGKDADNIMYINWLNMVRAGLCALEFYTPETGSWRQVTTICSVAGESYGPKAHYICKIAQSSLYSLTMYVMK